MRPLRIVAKLLIRISFVLLLFSYVQLRRSSILEDIENKLVTSAHFSKKQTERLPPTNDCNHLFCKCMISGSSRRPKIKYEISNKIVSWNKVLELNKRLGFGKASFELGVHGLPCRNITGSATCCSTKLFIRPGTSDIKVFKHIFQEGEYSFLYDLTFRPKLILDAGANCGFASIQIALLFPSARIIALEPSSDNFKALRQNIDLASFKSQIETKRKGIWYRTAYLSLLAKGRDIKDSQKESAKWSFRVMETREKSATVGISIDDLVNEHGKFDYVKMDIEGAEYEVFNYGKLDWLSSVRLLSIEMHDKHIPGITHTVLSIIAKASNHILRDRPFPCAEYYVWFSSGVYGLESGSNTCSVNVSSRAVINSKLEFSKGLFST